MNFGHTVFEVLMGHQYKKCQSSIQKFRLEFKGDLKLDGYLQNPSTYKQLVFYNTEQKDVGFFLNVWILREEGGVG